MQVRRAVPTKDEVEARCRETVKRGGGLSDDGAKRVLVVDDDEMLREMMAEVLEMEGCLVDEAGNGPAGVEKALAADYDLILLDNRMPGYWADEATRRVMAEKPQQRIVIVTGSPRDQSVHHALECGALGCLAKPFDIEDMARWLD